MSAGLRRAREEDIPQLEALITAEGLPGYGLAEYLKTFFVLNEGERVVGCAGLEVYGGAALLRSVVVAPERRKRDDGRRLVEAALAEARERSVRRVYLFTMHADSFFRIDAALLTKEQLFVADLGGGCFVLDDG